MKNLANYVLMGNIKVSGKKVWEKEDDYLLWFVISVEQIVLLVKIAIFAKLVKMDTTMKLSQQEEIWWEEVLIATVAMKIALHVLISTLVRDV